MNEISILNAWTLWASGHLSPNAMIWGVSVFWWGRFGKMMQFVGAVTIVADIIGPEKIRRFGTSLQSATTPTVLVHFLRNCFEWYTVIFRHTLMKDYTDEDERTPEKGRSRYLRLLNLLNYLVCFLLTAVIVISVELHPTGWVFLLEVAVLFSCLLVSISPIVTLLVIFSFTTAGLGFNTIFIKPLAWALEHPSLDRFIKIASLLLLLVGFHFELLAS